ncbi:methyltransferase domain-containing protein [Aureococcus anophagefferens]|nr:methyltransferase domain-containing protein [Aureococcus anophagefferens]
MATKLLLALGALGVCDGFRAAVAPAARGAPLQQTTNKMPEIPASMAEPGLKVPATAWSGRGPGPTAGRLPQEGLVEEVLEGAPILDAAAGEALGGHLVRHLESAGKVLEIGGSCSGASYIPADGGGELWFPPNEVVKADAAAVLQEGGVLEYADESFDAVVLYSAAELVTSPRATFRELWRVLKPGGRAIVAFSAARCSPGGHAAQQAQAWRDYNGSAKALGRRLLLPLQRGRAGRGHGRDGRRARPAALGRGLAGSAGLRLLLGPGGGSENNPIAKLAKEKAKEASSGTPLFVVMADRARDVPAGAGAAAAADNALWSVDHMEEGDKRLCAARLIQLIEDNEPDFGRREALAAQATRMLPDIYEVIKPMAVVIAALLAQFSASVACRWDPASGAQRKALKEGLGMATPATASGSPWATRRRRYRRRPRAARGAAEKVTADGAELADLDPEAAAKKKDDERRAKQVEAMLADIMKNKGGDSGPADRASRRRTTP